MYFSILKPPIGHDHKKYAYGVKKCRPSTSLLQLLSVLFFAWGTRPWNRLESIHIPSGPRWRRKRHLRSWLRHSRRVDGSDGGARTPEKLKSLRTRRAKGKCQNFGDKSRDVSEDFFHRFRSKTPSNRGWRDIDSFESIFGCEKIPSISHFGTKIYGGRREDCRSGDRSAGWRVCMQIPECSFSDDANP